MGFVDGMDVHVIVGGPAGSGVFSAGLLIGKAMSRMGKHVFIYKDYPSLIKGGHNYMHIRISDQPVHMVRKRADILVAFDRQTLEKHKADRTFALQSDGGKIPDAALDGLDPRVKSVYLPSLVLAELGASREVVEDLVKERFGGKKALEDNLEAILRAGLKSGEKRKGHLLLTGNEAIFLGAVRAGVRFLASYPMTPASSILHLFAKFDGKGLIFKQTEDEIAAINMALGASYAGMKSMVATSGGGFALMAEALGLGALAEIPLVIVESQRVGPSTGMPTYSEQSDLRFALHASQGDFPRVVLCPGTIKEVYTLIQRAVYISEFIQTPVILLTEKNISESHMSVRREDLKDEKPLERVLWSGEGEFKRYADTPSGISPMSLPGMKGGEYVATSYEHDETGFTTEEPEIREKMVRKRARKIKSIPDEWVDVKVFGDGKVLVVGFGSILQSALEAMKNVDFSYLHFPVLSPFPRSAKAVLESFSKVLIIENNHDGHLRGLIREKTGIWIEDSYNFYHGRPIYPEEIEKFVKGLM